MSIKSILRTLTVASTALLIASGSAYAEKPEKGNGGEQRGQTLLQPALQKLEAYILIRHYKGLRRR